MTSLSMDSQLVLPIGWPAFPKIMLELELVEMEQTKINWAMDTLNC